MSSTKKRKCGNELQSIIVSLAISKLVASGYGARRYFQSKQIARKKQQHIEAQGVVPESARYMATYRENSIGGREELRTDLVKQLKKAAKGWKKVSLHRFLSLKNAAGFLCQAQ